jgi:hypothetical protein
MLTAAVYIGILALFLAALARVGARPVLIIIGVSMVCSGVVGASLGGPSRIVGFILCDTFTLFAIAAWRDRPRDRIVALVSWLGVWWSMTYANAHMNYATYAAGLNCAAAFQLIVAGGMADDVGRRIDDWVGRRWPWASRALRFVAV